MSVVLEISIEVRKYENSSASDDATTIDGNRSPLYKPNCEPDEITAYDHGMGTENWSLQRLEP